MEILNLNQELEHLEDIKVKLTEELNKENVLLQDQRGELLRERRKMWEDGAHGVNDFDDIVSMATYDEQVRKEFGHYVRKDQIVRQLKYLLKTPYFGRIDFKEDGTDWTEQIYIGRYGFCNKKTFEYEIYDWRSPIANMFYECFPGRAAYKCPAGVISGDLSCKRQYQIKEGVLEYFYDTNMAVSDELLGKVLSENTDKVLRVIIDTITKEQNNAIRQPHGIDLLVVGPAGSGKTSVGMHRLAYLLYNNRENMAADKIVVMSRNSIFSSYIAGILPELGEENVQDVLFDEVISRGISKDYDKKDYYAQVEFLLTHTEACLRKRCIQLKYSEAFIEWIRTSLKGRRIPNRDPETAVLLYLELLKEYEGCTEDIYEYTNQCIEEMKLLYEDMLVIGYIRILIKDIRPMEQISHVVLDEAQDYNRLQLHILKTLYPKSRFTILADANQAVYPEISTLDMDVFKQIFGGKLKELPLSKSYRSTAPINAFAFDLLGIHDPDLYVDRPGKAPEEITTDDMIGMMYEIIKQTSPERSIGIMTCDKETAYDLKHKVGNYIESLDRNVEYIWKPDREIQEKITVMPIMLAKGLEFDIVIVWDNKSPEFWEQNPHLKYLMCTRALHELYILKETDQQTDFE